MPTKRTRTLLITAGLLYLFANQTQVGWLYVMSALLAGVVLAAGLLNRRVLKPVSVERQVGATLKPTLHEDDETTIQLAFHNAGRLNAAQLRATEVCILADPQHSHMPLFIPSLPPGETVRFDYDMIVYRRGLHRFEPLDITTGAPFGFFRSKRKLDAPSPLLVYPVVRPLRRLSLLDHRPAPELARARAGVGSEVIGTRQFRSGDSPRHIHWRSTARRQQLISKEFAEEAQPGLTLALDLATHAYPPAATKHTPFEWMVKAATSIGEYAHRRGYPLHLLAESEDQPPLKGPLTQTALLEFLARVEWGNVSSFAESLSNRSVQMLLAAIIPWPDPAIVTPLIALRNRGVGVLAIVLDPASFPDGGPDGRALATQLATADIDTRLLRFGEDWARQLAEDSTL